MIPIAKIFLTRSDINQPAQQQNLARLETPRTGFHNAAHMEE